MGHHLTENGRFKSDKYPWCPEGYFPLKMTDPHAQECILLYADLTKDTELAEDLRRAVSKQSREQLGKIKWIWIQSRRWRRTTE